MSTVSINRPPTDITPEEFFTSWIVAEYERVRGLDAELPAPPDVTVNMKLEGEDGGEWIITIVDAKLSVTSGAADSPTLGITLTVEDWREVVASPGGDDELVPADTSGIDVLFASTAAQDALQDASGTIRFEVTEYKGRTFGADVAFAGAAEPKATIAVDFETYKQVRNNSLPAPQAYFSGKIIISGDTNLAMQVGMSLMSKMA